MNELTTNGNVLNDIRRIIEDGRRQAYAAAGQIAIATYWNIGRRIVEEEQQGQERAKYGTKLIANLARQLTLEYGSGFGQRSLEQYRRFYLSFKDMEITNACVRNLTWTHLRIIMREATPEGRLLYMKEASEQMWSTRTLDRNISTQYYGRMMASQRQQLELPLPVVEGEDPKEYIKNPVVAEFMGFRKDAKFDESEMEQALLDNLQQFILELGRGFAFVDRQKHIKADTEDYYIDLVFYNYRMKRFVLFELKTHKLTHQDVGQLDMYVRMFDDLVKGEDDNPTLGVLLCTETDKTIARYSVLHESEQLFASKYMAYMPTEDELRREIEQQKQFFIAQHGKDGSPMEDIQSIESDTDGLLDEIMK